MVASTPQRLVETAEQLFAESGLDGVSLRQVAAAAGVNSAAVHYHFGSRERLVEAVLVRRLEGVQKRRDELLAFLSLEPDPRGVVGVLVRPWAELALHGGGPARAWLRLVARLWAQRRALVSGVALNLFPESYAALGEHLVAAAPGVPRAALERRAALIVQSAVSILADPQFFAAAGQPRAQLPGEDALVEELIDFLAGGLGAPSVGGAR